MTDTDIEMKVASAATPRTTEVKAAVLEWSSQNRVVPYLTENVSSLGIDALEKWMKTKGNVYIADGSRWFNAKSLATEDKYLEFLLETDLICDVMNLRDKRLGFKGVQGRKTIEYLHALMKQEALTGLVTKHVHERPIRKFWPIVALRHNTDAAALTSIFKDGLMTPLEIARSLGSGEQKAIQGADYDTTIQATDVDQAVDRFKHGFIGIYTQGFMDRNLAGMFESRQYSVGKDPVSLFLDPYLLNRFDFHLNSQDDSGSVSDYTISRAVLPDYLDRLGVLDGYGLGEIVFHNTIEPAFVKHVHFHKRTTSVTSVPPGVGKSFGVPRPDEVDEAEEQEKGEDKEAAAAIDVGNDEKKYPRPQQTVFYETDKAILRQVYIPSLTNVKLHPPRFCSRVTATSADGNLDAMVYFKIGCNCGLKGTDMDPDKVHLQILNQSGQIASGKMPLPPTKYFPPYSKLPIDPDDEAAYSEFVERYTLKQLQKQNGQA
jgi:hypothetical protein